MKHSIKEIVKDTEAKISHVCNGIVYYTIKVENTLYQLEIDSTNKEEFNNVYLESKMKAIYLMRWIRKSIENKDDKFIQLN